MLSQSQLFNILNHQNKWTIAESRDQLELFFLEYSRIEKKFRNSRIEEKFDKFRYSLVFIIKHNLLNKRLCDKIDYGENKDFN